MEQEAKAPWLTIRSADLTPEQRALMEELLSVHLMPWREGIVKRVSAGAFELMVCGRTKI